MKVLWVVNILFPYAAQHLGVKPAMTGAWMTSLAAQMAKHHEIELAVATMCDGSSVQTLSQDGIRYVLIPGGSRSMLTYCSETEVYWKQLIEQYQPDLIHIHGTEYVHGLSCLKAAPHIPSVVSIQGLLDACTKHYFGEIPYSTLLKHTTFRDIVRRDSLIQQRNKFKVRAQYEQETLSLVGHVIGRTRWDRANTRIMNPRLVYYHCYENLRDEFFQHQWDIQQIERHSIFVSQAGYPLKGLHLLLEALPYVIREYPHTMLYVAGYDMIDTSSWSKKIRLSGYGKYLKHLILKYHLSRHVTFTGPLDGAGMAERLCRSHVFVLPSLIENASNSLGEAMVLGVPTVASYAGGVPDVVEPNKSSILYAPKDTALLAESIRSVFSDDELALRLSRYGQKQARTQYHNEHNYRRMLQIYKDIVASEVLEPIRSEKLMFN